MQHVRPLLALAFALSIAGCAQPPAPDGDAGLDGATGDTSTRDAARACTSASTCDDGLYCNGTETCTGGVCAAGAAPSCDDGIACTVDRCDETRRACHSDVPDHDADGYADAACHDGTGVSLGTDCDDADPARHPGATETCDAMGHDEDCNPATYGARDADHDGYDDATCCNTGGACGTDCNDADLNVHPMAAEVCNGVDDDCDAMMDEGLPIRAYLPDCDLDGYGDDHATPTMACTVPAMATSCAGGAWVTMGGDCADTDANRNAGNPEVCNGVDDDCDAMIDDIIHGTVVCRAGQTRACHNASCNTDGLESCADTCLGWTGRCVATEVCNGCDDDNDGAVDNGFTCARGTSQSCTVSACGTTGTQVCGATCGWGTCTAMEICNYCDDNGNGNFWEERPLATTSASDHVGNCAGAGVTLYGPETACDTTPTANGFDLWATLLDGTANDQAGAIWLDPTTWVQGWGATDVSADITVSAVTAGGGAEMPLGGWSLILARAGTAGVGTPRNRGIPTTVDGLAASWFWSDFDSCYNPHAPPGSTDVVRFTPIRGGSIGAPLATTSAMDSGCFSGDPIAGGAPAFDGTASGTITEHLQIHFVPDDPTTSAVNEEQLVVTASANGTGISYTYLPGATTFGQPIGTGPLRIGITAGTFTQSGFTGPPASLVFGVPVRARVHIFNQTMNSGGRPPTFTYYVNATRAGLCP